MQQEAFQGAETGALPVSEAQASANSGASGEVARGRPRGSVNKVTRDVVKLICNQLGKHPADEVVRLYKLSLDELAEHFGATKKADAGAIKVQLLRWMFEHTVPKVAQVKVDNTNRLIVQFGKDMDLTGSLFDDDTVIDIDINENNGLAGVLP